MAGFHGRDVVIKLGGIGAAVGTLSGTGHSGIMERTITYNRTEVDVTSDSSNSNRELLPKPGMRSVDLTFSGVIRSDNFDNLIARFNDDAATDHVSVQIEHPAGSGAGGGTAAQNVTGKFFVNSIEVTGSHSGHVAFNLSMLSSGPVAIATR